MGSTTIEEKEKKIQQKNTVRQQSSKVLLLPKILYLNIFTQSGFQLAQLVKSLMVV